MKAGLAQTIVAVSLVVVSFAYVTEPPNMLLLLCAVAGMLLGLWLYTRKTAAARRVWVILLAIATGGVAGFFASLFYSAEPGQDVMVALLYAVVGTGALTGVAAIVLAVVWPSWWWRWGLMLSWGYVVMALVGRATVPMILLAATPLVIAKIVAALHGVESVGHVARPVRRSRRRRSI